MKYSISIIYLAAILLTGCVSFEMEHVVSDTVDASKALYQTIKRKSTGEEERKYSHTLTSKTIDNELEQINQCKDQIRQIISESGATLGKVLSESSEIIDLNDAKSVKCELVVIVRD